MTNVANVQVNGQLIVRLIKGKQPIYFLPEWPMLRTTPAGQPTGCGASFPFPQRSDSRVGRDSAISYLYGNGGCVHLFVVCTANLGSGVIAPCTYLIHFRNEFVLGARSEAERFKCGLEQFSENFYLHYAVCAATE